MLIHNGISRSLSQTATDWLKSIWILRDSATLYPCSKKHAAGGKFGTLMRPLFPGYVFIAFDPGKGLWRMNNSINGMDSLVSFEKRTATVPAEFVDAPLARCN